ncbi:GyrI-like domain-containing protein [Georgenia satyanarayanai]|uniref:GyrI-like domain-containing protein n=1 Tax=Georgenia satyanarayanai TaxID=860221 RepID=UPI00203DC01D|nr:GyrI-like domain-containing protein [Georgenia satyanarayanai]MCM3659974.1 GyrI-like domain-containing protein [Georgenia satyanarayanai]
MAESTPGTSRTDLKKTFDGYQARRGEFRVLEIPELRYLMVDGHGDPNTAPAFTAAVETLYPVAYALKFASKEQLGRDYVVPPLEGLWRASDMDAFTSARDKSQWDWTLLLLVPDWVPTSLAHDTVEHVRTTKRPALIDELRVAPLAEGTCVQTLHVGSFDEEGPVLDRLHREVLPERGLRPTGTHHEIYFSDVRRVAPERQRTILRQPVART